MVQIWSRCTLKFRGNETFVGHRVSTRNHAKRTLLSKRQVFPHGGPLTCASLTYQDCAPGDLQDAAAALMALHGGTFARIYMKRESNQNFLGNEVYYTNCLILLVKSMLCSKLHCQKALIKFPFYMRFTDAIPARDSVCRRRFRISRGEENRFIVHSWT